MKTIYIYLFLLGVLCISCGEDRRKEYIGMTATDRWIEAQMAEHYYWNEDMPASNKLNYFQNADVFFKSVLSPKDKNRINGSPFSYIQDLTVSGSNTRSTLETTYGMEYYYVTNPQSRSEYFARILYTIKDSPADIAGIKRGDWIFSIDQKPITSERLQNGILLSGSGINVEVGTVDAELNPVDSVSVTIGPARSIINNPIYYSNIYEIGNKKIGYLVYNSFISGEGDSDTRYNDMLSDLSNEFKAENVTEFVLDLRYNLGGELNRPVPLLCTMLTEKSSIGKVMGHVEYNSLNTAKNWSLSFLQEHLNGGTNLGLNRVFIITTEMTASASEAVIKFLDPYTKVHTIGTQTVGKNVGSEEIRHDTISWALHPITCKIYNSNGMSDYEAGISPDPLYIFDERAYVEMLPLGNPNELLLNKALTLATVGFLPSEPEEEEEEEEEQPTRSHSPIIKNIKSAGNSLDRKAKYMPGVLVIDR